MRTKNFLKHLIMGAMLLATGKVASQVTTASNVAFGPTDFLGWDNTGSNNFPLVVKHELNQPIDWYTNAIRRITLLPNATYAIGGFPAQVKNGSLLLSPNVDGFYAGGAPGPFTGLHLAAATNNTQQAGYRSNMGNGVTMTGNNDQMYVGQLFSDLDFTDAAIVWSDNPGEFQADRLTFNFTSSYNAGASSGNSSFRGLQTLLIQPASSGQEAFVGLGDFDAASATPSERLDILTGRLRIRELPLAVNENANLVKYLVTDNNGVIHWRNVPGGGGGGCEWDQFSGSNNLRTAWSGAAIGCPGETSRVGIGVGTTLRAKLHVERTFTEGGGENMTGLFWALGAQSAGGKVALRARADGQSVDNFGVQSIVTNASSTNRALQGTATVENTFTTVNNRAVDASAVVNQGANSTNNIGALGFSSIGGTATNSYGVRGQAQASGVVTKNFGVHGDAKGDGALQSYGVYGTANGPSTTFRCGVFGTAPVLYDVDAFEGSWAGYFDGIVRISGNAYFNGNMLVTSDESLKTNVAPLEQAGERLNHLAPITYDFVQSEHPHMDLPVGRQIGLGAQHVREVFPELVEEVPVPAVFDSTGVQIASATSHLAVNYTGLIPVLIAAYQEQHAQIATEQATNTALTDRLAEQEEALSLVREELAHVREALASCCANPTNGDTRLLTTPPAEGSDDLNKALEGDARHLHIQPNPFTERTTLHYRLERAGRMQLLANCADGKSLKVLQEAALEAGAYQFNWETADLTPGVYYVTLLLDGEPLVKKAVKVMR
jgi:hypothetical protein